VGGVCELIDLAINEFVIESRHNLIEGPFYKIQQIIMKTLGCEVAGQVLPGRQRRDQIASGHLTPRESLSEPVGATSCAIHHVNLSVIDQPSLARTTDVGPPPKL
jgi:hypothetical protein